MTVDWRNPSLDGPLPLGAQIHYMKTDFPSFLPTWKGQRVTWRGCLNPTPLSPSYPVRVQYDLGMSPRVYPACVLAGRDGASPPHVYPKGHLCLHQPKYRDWSASMPVSKTVVPWAALWFYFYESWLITGEWAAKEEHPSPGMAKEEFLARPIEKPTSRA